jgi:hypothetical protein
MLALDVLFVLHADVGTDVGNGNNKEDKHIPIVSTGGGGNGMFSLWQTAPMRGEREKREKVAAKNTSGVLCAILRLWAKVAVSAGISGTGTEHTDRGTYLSTTVAIPCGAKSRLLASCV